jgi:hypothetical protein
MSGRAIVVVAIHRTEHYHESTHFASTPQTLSSRIADVKTPGYVLWIASAAGLNLVMALPIFIGEWVAGAIACTSTRGEFPRAARQQLDDHNAVNIESPMSAELASSGWRPPQGAGALTTS